MKKNSQSSETLRKIIFAGLMAALCYIGYAIFPPISVTGTKIHLGNAFVVLGALLLGGLYGGLSGAIGLSLADILSGYAVSAPRTFICKLVIGLVCGLIAHHLFHISENREKTYIVRAAIVASVGSLLVNCIFEPSLKWVWYMFLFPDPEKAESAIKTLLAITTYSTLINAAINSVIAIILYLALRPVLKKSGLFFCLSKKNHPTENETSETH